MAPPKKKEVPAARSDASRVTLIEAITAPLGFFVLALLIVEAFLASVLIFGKLPEGTVWYGVLAGVGMFVFVVGLVGLLVWFKPENLTFDKTAHLMDRGKLTWGTDQRQVPTEKVSSKPMKGPQP